MAYLIRGRRDFTINGESALETVGLVVDNLDPPPMAERRIIEHSGGLDSDIVTPDDVFGDITVTISARVIRKPNDFDNSQIYAFLQNAKTLGLSTLPGKHFRVRAVSGIVPLSDLHGNECAYSISFRCAPFKYFTDNEYTAFNGGTIENPGTRFCRPVYHITGTQTVTLTVNGTSFTVTGAEGTDIYIDSERMLCYRMNGTTAVNILPKTSGQFPFLQPGTNNVSISAGTMTVKLNARCY